MSTIKDSINIIVLDDMPVYRLVLRNVLLKKFPQCTIHEAENGSQIMELCERSHPDIVITDLQMPVKDGFEVLSDLSKISANYPVMVISAYATPKALEKVIDLGCLGFVDKSSSMKVILEGVESVIAGKPYYSPFIQSLIEEHFKNVCKESAPNTNQR